MQHNQRASDKSLKFTPPSSFAASPPTPPPTDEKPTAKVRYLIRILKGRQDGRGFWCDPWKTIPLTFAEFNELQNQIDADVSLRGYVDDKVRCDYFCHSQKLVFRMLTIVHESFTRRVDAAIQAQLDTFANGADLAADFARSILPTGSLRMQFEQGEVDEKEEAIDVDLHRPLSQHEPDISFGHKDAKWPGVVIEVSYSQKKKDLPRLANEYIVGSDGNIRAVIGLDIEYRGTQTASLSIWRPQVRVSEEDGQRELIAVQTEVEKVFRLEGGEPVPSTRLSLPLEDFAPKRLAKQFALLDKEVSLSSEMLCRYLEMAEARTQAKHSGLRDSPEPGVRKRKRPITPPEELAPSDEATFRTGEENVANRAERDDLSYKASSLSSEDGS